MTDKVKEHVSTLQKDMSLIPGGLTSHLQPADVSWSHSRLLTVSYTISGCLLETSPTLLLAT